MVDESQGRNTTWWKVRAAVPAWAATVQQRLFSVGKGVAYWGAVSLGGIVLAAVTAQLLGVPLISAAQANIGSTIGSIFGNILYDLFIIPLFLAGMLFSYILELVLLYPYGGNDSALTIAWQGNGFINVSAVVTGWKLVRDVCNIFFSLIFIIIALANVLKIEAYSWKQLLPKFFLMVILINFSRTIAGVFTDFATIVMATFGSAFPGSFARGLVGGFGLPSIFNILSGSDYSLTGSGTSLASATSQSGFAASMFAYVAAVFMIGIFDVLILTFAITLIFRIIMLWFLIVMSPLAYLSRILPSTTKYSSQWWEMFGRYVIVGPLVTFFLWLSMTMIVGNNCTATGDAASFKSGNPIGCGIAVSVDAAQSGK